MAKKDKVLKAAEENSLLEFFQANENAKEVNIIKYWGAGDKSSADQNDLTALIHLLGFIRALEKKFQKSINLTLIFTDTHAILNGYPINDFKKYFKDIGRVLNYFNYDHIFMSEILSNYLHENNLKNVEELVQSIISTCRNRNLEIFYEDSGPIETLRRSAEKYSLRYKNKGNFNKNAFENIDQAVDSYLTITALEKPVIEKRYENSLLLTYNSFLDGYLTLPGLPAIQIYSYRRGVISRPWFSRFKKTNLCVE
jgi:hypothetical protein